MSRTASLCPRPSQLDLASVQLTHLIRPSDHRVKVAADAADSATETGMYPLYCLVCGGSNGLGVPQFLGQFFFVF